ncbi:MbnP family protein [Lewinella cohaerens]|uniref:MbnP family protein n=1 Tax=Lewinella cohaerens TaxID=70995 RepID=UPI00035FFBA4|nr:MbnP family protein [Lewinella cohaerens]
MKTHLLFVFLLASLMTQAQINVTLNIHHKLGDEAFAMETSATNNIGSTFYYSRLDYYIAEISLIHDDGQETMIEDLYMLVDATEETSEFLGNLDITNIEAIRFHIGVDEAKNHLDPTIYHSSHPLAPQNPSMHWGWVSGYRFGAFEGRSGSALNQTWELHPLDDDNYFQTEVPLDLAITGDELTIDLDANYVRAVEDIDLDSGPLIHGGYGLAVVSLHNFRDYVFTPSALINSNEEALAINAFKVYPNPGTTKAANIFIATDTDEVYQLQVTNAQGQLVRQMAQVHSNNEIDLGLKTAGLYFLSLQQNGKVVMTERLVIQ